MHSNIYGTGLTRRVRQAPSPCPRAADLASVVPTVSQPRQPDVAPYRLAVETKSQTVLHTAYRAGRSALVAITDRSELSPSEDTAVQLPAIVPASHLGPTSHQITLSDASGSDSERDEPTQQRHGSTDTAHPAYTAAAVAAAGAAAAAAAASTRQQSSTKQAQQRRQKRQSSSKGRHEFTHTTLQQPTAAGNSTSTQRRQPQQQLPQQHQQQQQRIGAFTAKRVAAAVTSLLVLLVALGAGNTARSLLLKQAAARLATSSSSSSSIASVLNSNAGPAAVLGAPSFGTSAGGGSSTIWGAAGLLAGTFRAASNRHAQHRYLAAAADGSSSAAAGSIAAAGEAAGSWLNRNGGAPKRLHAAVGLIKSMHSGGNSGGSSSTAPGDALPAAAAAAAAAAADSAGAAAAAAVSPSAGLTPGDGSVTTPVGPLIKMYAVVDESVVSPYKGATWGEVVRHMAQRLQWNNPRFSLEILSQQQLQQDAAARDSLAAALSGSSSSSSAGSSGSPIFVSIGISDPDLLNYLGQATGKLRTALFWDSAGKMQSSSRVDGFAPATAGPFAQFLADKVGFSAEARAARVLNTIDSLWGRHTSDDLLFIWLVLLNEYVTPVPEVANTTKGTDLPSLVCMIKNCGQKIVDCVSDTRCKAGLDCLESCAFNDQVCQYRCIVSYETPKFEQFALCILQLHNCRGLDAQMPMMPNPAPMSSWRGQALTHEAAESLFIGWKQQGPQMPQGDQALKPWSWLVAAGKNPAYDFFPCQHQLYSYGKGKGQMWYEPVFKALTLDGQEVWRRRRYRVRRGTEPGTFYYSVLDNGVTSNEYWRIMDCAEDLEFCLFYYSGAAAAAGLSYSGAVLATKDGTWPEQYTQRIHEALHRAGIEPWELSTVDNSACAGAPL